MSDENFLFIIGVIIFLIFIGYQMGKAEYQATIIELQNLKTNYVQLNDKYNLLNQSYGQLNTTYIKLNEEYNSLKNKHETLLSEISNYFIEMALFDLSPLRKYRFAYDLIKITICHQNPTLSIC